MTYEPKCKVQHRCRYRGDDAGVYLPHCIFAGNMNKRIKARIESAAHIYPDDPDGEAMPGEREAGLRDLLGDILVYCRDHKIRFEKVMIDAILERID